MSTVTRVLSEGIIHLEDLPVDEFIAAVKGLPSMIAQEKLDGSQLWLGVDEGGKFFTSREGKKSNAERRYSSTDWPKVSAFNQFRAAHAALEKAQDQITRVMRPGDMVEAEVLFGRQPNSVMYGAGGKSYIAFLRGVNGTPDAIADQLAKTLHNQQVTAEVELVSSTDGENLEDSTERVTFQFTQPHQVDPAKLKTVTVAAKLITQLETFLRGKSALGMSNGELAKLSLTSVPKERREMAKAARAEVLAKIQTEFKLPIKNALLDKVVRKIRSGMSDEDGDDIGIEGIVLRDPKSGAQIKVVDKDVFTTINKFNQSARAQIQGALNTTDPDASLEAQGGLVGRLRIRIADALGNRELAKGSNIRKLLEPIKGASPEDAIKNLAASMPANNDPQMIKRKILALISETAVELKTQLDTFKDSKDQYRLKLKNGKELGLSDETVKKTLVSFAEARRNLETLFEKIKPTKTLAQILAVMYGGAAKAVHANDDEVVAEGFLLEKKGELDITEYNGKDTFQLLNLYLATVFQAILMFQTDDVIGMRLLRDRPHYLLKKHSHAMSVLNHWGYPIWRAARPEVKKHLTKKTAFELAKFTKDIPTPWWKYFHQQLSYGKDQDVNWHDAKKLLARLMDLSGVRNERLNTLLDLMIRFDKLDTDEKLSAVKKLISYVRLYSPRSILLQRVRAIEAELKDKEPMVAENLLKKIAALTEEGEGEGGGGDGGVAMSTLATATTTGAIASREVRTFNMRRRTEKRTRNPDIKSTMLKFRDPRKTEKHS